MKRLVLCLLLAGCAHAPVTPPEPVVITKEVRVPVPVPCKVTLPADGPLPSAGADLTDDVFELAKLALVDRAELLARVAVWAAAARSCAG